MFAGMKAVRYTAASHTVDASGLAGRRWSGTSLPNRETLRMCRLAEGRAVVGQGYAAVRRAGGGHFRVSLWFRREAVQKQHILICKVRYFPSVVLERYRMSTQRDSGILLHQKGARLLAKESRKITSPRSVAAWGFSTVSRDSEPREEPGSCPAPFSPS